MQTISQKSLNDLMYYRTIPVFRYDINYPFFTTTCSSSAANSINSHYASLAKQKESYCRNTLFPQAAENAQFIQVNYPPFNTYEFHMTYEVTYNSNCITSLYLEEYTFMGGAHGATVRTSDTWDFRSGNKMELKDFFKHNPNYRQDLENWIIHQISQKTKDNQTAYFDDYAKLVKDTFQPDSFYLIPQGIIIYFQQYDIAPYASGIPEFLIPFPQ